MSQISWQVELCVLQVWRGYLLNAKITHSGCLIPMSLFRVGYCRNDHSILTEVLACILFICCQPCFCLLWMSPAPPVSQRNHHVLVNWSRTLCSELQGGVHSNPASLKPLLPHQATLLMVLLLVANTAGQISSTFSVPQELLT